MLQYAASRLKLAPEGAAISFGALALAAIALAAGGRISGLLLLSAGLAVAMFFRDPERSPPDRSGLVVSGADGKVVAILRRAFAGTGEQEWQQVSVFMSPLNVHVNRAPVSGEVVKVEHTAGEFGAAFSDQASEHNERNLLVFQGTDGQRHAMVQIAGYLARRIVCRVRPWDKIRQGQRIGLIMFGSRVDHLLPAGYQVRVSLGERVRAGETVIGEIAQ